MDFIKKFFVVEEDTQTKPVAVDLNKFKTTPMEPVFQNVSDENSKKFVEHFDKLFSDQNLPGPDYFEYSKMTEAMGDLDPVVKIKSSFAALQSQKLTKEVLLSSANHYLEAIQKDKENFIKAIEESVINNSKAKEIESLEIKIAKNKAIIESLTLEIDNDEQRTNSLSAEINDEHQKMINNKNSYDLACSKRIEQIKKDIDLITTQI